MAAHTGLRKVLGLLCAHRGEGVGVGGQMFVDWPIKTKVSWEWQPFGVGLSGSIESQTSPHKDESR